MDTGETNNAGEVSVVEQSLSNFDYFFNEPYLLPIQMGAVEEVQIMQV